MQQGEDTKRGSTSGMYGLNGGGLTEGAFDEDATKHLENQFFHLKDQVPYSPGYSDTPTARATEQEGKS